MYHKSGFVTIIGNSNVGKSTLLNNLVGRQLSIITPKLQTTRHRIMGILNNMNYQIIFSDTPGIISYKSTLQKYMMYSLKNSLTDADLIVYMIDAKKYYYNTNFLKTINKQYTNYIVVINKIDLIKPQELDKIVNNLQNNFTSCQILPISALKKINLDLLLNKIIKLLPKRKAYYPKNLFTDKKNIFFVTEIIRKYILLLYKKEIPYSTNVITDNIYVHDNFIKINSIIHLEKESQKIIIIGHKGKTLKKLMDLSRNELKFIYKKQIYLTFYIKIKKKWRNNELYIKKNVYND